MPVVDRREFGGRFTVKENSQRLANYRYLEIQLMEMIGGWSHTTPQLNFKATFGYHVYDHAQAADMLSERQEQLRAAGDAQEPATDDFARLCEYVWNLTDTVDRLVAVYRVLEPHLVSTYVYHADATDPLTDTPDRSPPPPSRRSWSIPHRLGPGRPRKPHRIQGRPPPRPRRPVRHRGASCGMRWRHRPGD